MLVVCEYGIVGNNFIVVISEKCVVVYIVSWIVSYFCVCFVAFSVNSTLKNILNTSLYI